MCILYDILGDHMFADFDEDMKFPDAFKSLTIVQWIDESNDLCLCLECLDYFEVHWKTDNDIYSPLHIGEFNRIL
jgi:hypothetical protein